MKKGLGAEGRLPACWGGRGTQSQGRGGVGGWGMGEGKEERGRWWAPPHARALVRERRGVLSGSHTVSRDWGQQHRLSEEQDWNEGVTRPRRRQGGSRRTARALVRAGHRERPVRTGLQKAFIFFLSFLYFLQVSTLKTYSEMFRYSDIQITSRHKQTQNREGGG